jgi:hypothetical protein
MPITKAKAKTARAGIVTIVAPADRGPNGAALHLHAGKVIAAAQGQTAHPDREEIVHADPAPVGTVAQADGATTGTGMIAPHAKPRARHQRA